MRWFGHLARTEHMRNAYEILVGKPEEKRALGRPRRKWEDLRQTVWEGVD